jgi:hypothetical protein
MPCTASNLKQRLSGFESGKRYYDFDPSSFHPTNQRVRVFVVAVYIVATDHFLIPENEVSIDRLRFTLALLLGTTG